MSDNIQESEQPKKSEVKKLGERFKPFNKEEPNFKLKYYPEDQANNYKDNILLDLGLENIPKLPIHFNVFWTRGRIGDYFTPFSPPEAYQIDQDDLKLETRREKTKDPKYKKDIDISKNSHSLRIARDEGDLARTNLTKEDIKKLSPIFSRLRVQVYFPGSPEGTSFEDPDFHFPTAFESGPWRVTFSSGILTFEEYYPLEVGPLPISKALYSGEREGLWLYLPDDPEKLKDIEVQFVLVDEKESD